MNCCVTRFATALCLLLLIVPAVRADSLCNDFSDAAAGSRLQWNNSAVRVDKIVQDTLINYPFATQAQQNRMRKLSHSASLDIWIYQWTVPAFFRQPCASSCVAVDISGQKAALQEKLQFQLTTSSRILLKLYAQNAISLDLLERAKRRISRYNQRATEILALTSDSAEVCR